MSLKNLGIRSVTGAIFVAILISSILVHPNIFALLFLVISFLGAWEFNTIVEKNIQSFPSKLVCLLMNATSYIIITFSILFPNYSYLLYFLLLVFPISMVVEMYRKTGTSIQNVALNFMSVVYIAIPFAILNYFYSFYIPNANNGYFLMAFFILIWANDTGAYIIGSLIGKHRFFERISPKKSWEGFWGGLIFSMINGYFINDYFEFLPLTAWLGLNLMIVLSASFGDLAESMIKRNLGIKDSGKILPGHGGILDRFDAVIFSSPFVFIYLQLFNYIK